LLTALIEEGLRRVVKERAASILQEIYGMDSVARLSVARLR
jgi:hypothetical protein